MVGLSDNVVSNAEDFFAEDKGLIIFFRGGFCKIDGIFVLFKGENGVTGSFERENEVFYVFCKFLRNGIFCTESGFVDLLFEFVSFVRKTLEKMGGITREIDFFNA